MSDIIVELESLYPEKKTLFNSRIFAVCTRLTLSRIAAATDLSLTATATLVFENGLVEATGFG